MSRLTSGLATEVKEYQWSAKCQRGGNAMVYAACRPFDTPDAIDGVSAAVWVCKMISFKIEGRATARKLRVSFPYLHVKKKSVRIKYACQK